MNKAILGLLVSCLTVICYSQTTITLQPDSSGGKDAFIATNVSSGTHQDYLALAWTNSGTDVWARGLLEFDLSSIPHGATIISASLSLYYSSDSPNDGHSSLSGSNESVLQRITSSWDEHSVTWATQPSTTDTNAVTLAESTSLDQDYPDIDVTALIQDMINNPSTSYGFMFRLVTEIKYRSMLFASSDHPDPAKHPKLVITYSDNSGIQNQARSEQSIISSPNPFTDVTIITLPNTKNESLTLTLYNSKGQIVRSLDNLNKDKIALYREGLPKGVYYANVYSKMKSYGINKLIIY